MVYYIFFSVHLPIYVFSRLNYLHFCRDYKKIRREISATSFITSTFTHTQLLHVQECRSGEPIRQNSRTLESRVSVHNVQQGTHHLRNRLQYRPLGSAPPTFAAFLSYINTYNISWTPRRANKILSRASTKTDCSQISASDYLHTHTRTIESTLGSVYILICTYIEATLQKRAHTTTWLRAAE